MPNIVPIVEGPGDVEAVPILVRRILEEQQHWTWSVGRPKKAGGLASLQNKLEAFLQLASLDRDCGGILVLVDLDDGCPKQEAVSLARAVHKTLLPVPTAIVFAHREYEAWFLASLPSLGGSYGLPPNLIYSEDVENKRGAKEWLQQQMPPGKAYKETIHQARFTHRIDLDVARQRSRSFRRLCHAVEQLVRNADQPQRGMVTPQP